MPWHDGNKVIAREIPTRMNINSRKKRNNYIYILKALAIFSVICAHSTPLAVDSSKCNVISSKVLDYLGTFGVPIFFCISGYLFAGNTRTWGDFWKRKVITLFLPWVCCETLLWLYVVLRKGGISIVAWLLFFLGYHHTTYYLTILVLFYVIYWKIRKLGVIWTLNVVSIISMLETGWNVGVFHQLNVILNSYYLNPFNWMLFFGIGLLIQREQQKVVQCFGGRWGVLCVCGSMAYFIIHVYLGLEMYYFSRYALIGNLLNLGTVVYLGQKLSNRKKKELLLKIGEWSFSIYLLHQFVAGIVVAITNHWDFFILTLCRPWIILIITTGVVMTIDNIFREKLSWVRTIIGIR